MALTSVGVSGLVGVLGVGLPALSQRAERRFKINATTADRTAADLTWVREQRLGAYQRVVASVRQHQDLGDDADYRAAATQASATLRALTAMEAGQPFQPPQTFDVAHWQALRRSALKLAEDDVVLWGSLPLRRAWAHLVHCADEHDGRVYASRVAEGEGGGDPANYRSAALGALAAARAAVRDRVAADLQGEALDS